MLEEIDVGPQLRGLLGELVDLVPVVLVFEGLHLHAEVVEHLIVRVEFPLRDVELEGAHDSVNRSETSRRRALSLASARRGTHGSVGGPQLLALPLHDREVVGQVVLVLRVEALEVRGVSLEVPHELAQLTSEAVKVHRRLASGLLGAGSGLGHPLVEVVQAVQRALDDLLNALDAPLDVRVAVDEGVHLIHPRLHGGLLALEILPEAVLAEEHALYENAQLLGATALIWRRRIFQSGGSSSAGR